MCNVAWLVCLCVFVFVCVFERGLSVVVSSVYDLLCDVAWCVLCVLSCVCECLCVLLCMCVLFVMY